MKPCKRLIMLARDEAHNILIARNRQLGEAFLHDGVDIKDNLDVNYENIRK